MPNQHLPGGLWSCLCRQAFPAYFFSLCRLFGCQATFRGARIRKTEISWENPTISVLRARSHDPEAIYIYALSFKSACGANRTICAAIPWSGGGIPSGAAEGLAGTMSKQAKGCHPSSARVCPVGRSAAPPLTEERRKASVICGARMAINRPTKCHFPGLFYHILSGGARCGEADLKGQAHSGKMTVWSSSKGRSCGGFRSEAAMRPA